MVGGLRFRMTKDINYKNLYKFLKENPVKCLKCGNDSHVCYMSYDGKIPDQIWMSFDCRKCHIVTSFQMIDDKLILSSPYISPEISKDFIGITTEFEHWCIK